MYINTYLTGRNFFLELRLGESGFSFSVIQNFCRITYTDKQSKAVNPITEDLLNYSRSF